MKKEFDTCPKAIDESRLYGFSWMEFVAGIPSPLVLVTGYKENGKPNASMQSWTSFVGNGGFYCIFGSVNKNTHMYASVQQTKQLVINFPDKDNFLKCMDTIKNNDYENDEITMSDLTAEPASKVNAPRIRECFLNLECEYVWEKELFPGSAHVVMCVRVVNLCMDDAYYDNEKKGRYGDTGYLYNIRSLRNPETGETEDAAVGILQKYAVYDELKKR